MTRPTALLLLAIADLGCRPAANPTAAAPPMTIRECNEQTSLGASVNGTPYTCEDGRWVVDTAGIEAMKARAWEALNAERARRVAERPWDESRLPTIPPLEFFARRPDEED